MELLQAVLGDCSVFFIMLAQETITIFSYFFVLTWYKKKRNLYPLRLIVCAASSILLCVPLAIFRTHFNIIGVRIFNSSAILCFIIIWLLVCYKEKPSEILLCFTGIVAAKNFSGQLFALLLNCFGVDDLVSMSFFSEYNSVRDWSIYWLIHLILLAGIYLLLRKRENLEDDETIFSSIFLAIITFLVTSVLSTVVRQYQSTSFPLSVCIKIFSLVCYSLLLLSRANLLFRSHISKELQITEQLLYQEKKHYAEMKSNIDVINMKCHDIKNQLTAFQGRLTEEEIGSLQEAIKIYDSSIKTGSEILDTVLYQKQLYCEKNGINFKFMCNGSAFSFMSGSDLYALATNSLNNAIEAVQKVSPEKQIIDFIVDSKNGNAFIEASNYFNPDCTVTSGTSKEDKLHHGYGMKSMQYITERYNGVMTTDSKDDIFFLSVRFILPS